MKHFVLFACVAVGLIFAGCRNRQEPLVPVVVQEAEPKDTAVLEFPHPKEKQLTAADISLTKELLYDQHTLEDTYPYKDTVRSFKWDVIRNCLAYIENMQRDTTARWVVLQNYKNLNKEAPLVRSSCGMCTAVYLIHWAWSAINRCRCICPLIRWCPNVMVEMVLSLI